MTVKTNQFETEFALTLTGQGDLLNMLMWANKGDRITLHLPTNARITGTIGDDSEWYIYAYGDDTAITDWVNMARTELQRYMETMATMAVWQS